MSLHDLPSELLARIMGMLLRRDPSSSSSFYTSGESAVFSLVCAFRLCAPPSPQKTTRLERMLAKAVRGSYVPAMCTLLAAPDLQDTYALTRALDYVRPCSLEVPPAWHLMAKDKETEVRMVQERARSAWRAYLRNLDPNGHMQGTSNLALWAVHVIQEEDDAERREGICDLREMYASGKVRVATSVSTLEKVLTERLMDGTRLAMQTRRREVFLAILDADASRLDDARTLEREGCLEEEGSGTTLLHLACENARSHGGGGTEWAIEPLLGCALGRLCAGVRDARGRLPRERLPPRAAEVWGRLLPEGPRAASS